MTSRYFHVMSPRNDVYQAIAIQEGGKLDLSFQSEEKSMSRTTRSSIFVLVVIAIFSGVTIVTQSTVRSDLPEHIKNRTEPNRTKQNRTEPNRTEQNRTGPNRTEEQSSESTRVFKPVELTRKEQHGSWIGNNWVPPPGWRLYSASELRHFYRDTSILWIGDSTARRAATTMYGILNTTNSSSGHVSVDEISDPNIIDVNARKNNIEVCNRWANHTHKPELCRTMPGGSGRGGSFLLKWDPCLAGLELFLRDELSGNSNITADVDIVIISLGIWEALRPRVCREKNENRTRSMLQIQNDTISLLQKLQSPLRTIVWRTSGFMASGKEDEDFVVDKQNEDFVVNMNGKAMDEIEEIVTGVGRSLNSTSNLTFVDWGGAVYPRSFGKSRIEGDMRPHYGLEARYVLVQMITNQLASRLPGVHL
jgi:hypothetical protein